jgi:hypothetical protein
LSSMVIPRARQLAGASVDVGGLDALTKQRAERT